MAGDWIKVEHSTIDKPEILRLADLLGVKPNEALGMMVSFWVWLDRNSRNGVVTHMSRSTLDNVTHTPGFAASLIDIGWAEIDDATGVITVPNHDRHNGSPAKTRALGKDRASRLRNESIVTNALPEKRREEKVKYIAQPVAAKETKPSLRPLPADFGISDRVRQWAEEKGHDRLETRLEHFIGYAKRSGKRWVDWDEAFMGAIRENWAKLPEQHQASTRSRQVAL